MSYQKQNGHKHVRHYSRTGKLSLLAILASLVLPGVASAAVQDFTVYNWNGTPNSTVKAMEQATVWDSALLSRYWKTSTVAFTQQGGWPIYLVPDGALPRGESGFHAQKGGQPFASVFGLDKLATTTAFSHEILEMLVDPMDTKILAIRHQLLLMEVSDPVMNDTLTAPNGIYVADAVTPSWYTIQSGPWDLAGDLRWAREVQGILEFFSPI